MWSCMIGAVGEFHPALNVKTPLEVTVGPAYDTQAPLNAGIIIPVVVPPIRESFSKRATINPPPVRKVEYHDL